jgi:hypothetical protein
VLHTPGHAPGTYPYSLRIRAVDLNRGSF